MTILTKTPNRHRLQHKAAKKIGADIGADIASDGECTPNGYEAFIQPFAGPGHAPVLLREVLRYCAPQPGMRVLDATFGRGGYSRALLHAGAEVTAIDCDPDAASEAASINNHKFNFISASFDDIYRLGLEPFDIVLFDLGLSTPQLTSSGRGFSFLRDEPLDMRADPRRPLTAADLINNRTQNELADLFRQYGDEPQAGRIARYIVRDRPFLTAKALADAVEAAVPAASHGKTHAATRVFQALRIVVNDELNRLQIALDKVTEVLKIGGRLGVVSFHSGEDRIVKHFLAPPAGASRYAPPPSDDCRWGGRFKAVPAEDEIAYNRASRSARLRGAVLER